MPWSRLCIYECRIVKKGRDTFAAKDESRKSTTKLRIRYSRDFMQICTMVNKANAKYADTICKEKCFEISQTRQSDRTLAAKNDVDSERWKYIGLLT